MAALVRRFGYLGLAVWLMGGVSTSVNAQCAPTPMCPAVSVIGPSGLPEKDKPLSFKASLSPDTGDSDLEFGWTVTSGEIVSGQGTRELLVRVPNDQSFAITATLTVRDRRIGCHASDSATAQYKAGPQTSNLIIDVRTFPANMHGDHFVQIAEALAANPTARLFVVFGRKDPRMFRSTERDLRIRLTEAAKTLNRIHFVRSAQKVDRVTFWLVPAGATPPSDHN